MPLEAGLLILAQLQIDHAEYLEPISSLTQPQSGGSLAYPTTQQEELPTMPQEADLQTSVLAVDSEETL